MKILITGGCGFIGSNFINNNVLDKNNKILNLDKLTYAGNLENLSSINHHSNYEFINGDICNKQLVINIIEKFQPDTIINFAAESHVDRSIDSPMDFIQTNIVGTAILLSSVFNYWKKEKNKNFRFLHVSTDEVFGSLENDGLFTENTPYDPSSPYSASKASSDHLVRAWNRTYGLPTLITNCSNNYGPYQFPEKLIPLMIANCLDGKSLPVYGTGENIRDWLYVKDHCDSIYEVVNRGKVGETYNIGGNNEIQNIKLVKSICKVLDKIRPRSNGDSYVKLITYVKDRPGHDLRYAIDSSKIKNELGWKPNETFETGLLKTIKWYLDNEKWWRNIQNNNYNQERLGLKN